MAGGNRKRWRADSPRHGGRWRGAFIGACIASPPALTITMRWSREPLSGDAGKRSGRAGLSESPGDRTYGDYAEMAERNRCGMTASRLQRS